MTDTPETLDELANARRYCPQCGHANRLTARVCVNCGQALSMINPDSQTAAVAPVAEPKRATTASSPLTKRAKRCPDCATICKLDAKVCPNCGHHFQTDFSQAIPAVTTAAAKPEAPRSVLSEAPIVQMPSAGISLPPDNPKPVMLPPDPTPAARPALKPAPPPTPPVAPPVDDVDNADSTDGEPAPDLTDVDLSALRRRNNDSASGFFSRGGFFKKDNS